MSSKDDNLSSYTEYNKTLRAWIVGFGFGVPALFIINTDAQSKLLKADDCNLIIWLFLIGAAAQVLMAFVNKIVSWCAYYKHDNGTHKDNYVISFFASLENMFIIDVAFDFISLLTFSWSIYLIVGIFIDT